MIKKQNVIFVEVYIPKTVKGTCTFTFQMEILLKREKSHAVDISIPQNGLLLHTNKFLVF